MSDLTNAELRMQIRKAIGVTPNSNAWFTRQEIKIIARKATPAANWLTDDREKRNYKNNESIFPTYLLFWEKQETVNTHPKRSNLIKIHEFLTKDAKHQSTNKILVDEESFSINKEVNNIFSHIPKSLLSRAKEVVIQKGSMNISIKL